MEIEHLKISELKNNRHNARKHGDMQIRQLCDSIRQYGFNHPVLVDEGGVIIAGHGRVQAAKKLGMTEVPCIRIEHLNEKQKRAFMLADNRIAMNGEWDNDLLRQELDFTGDFVKLEDLGFTPLELDVLFQDEEEDGGEVESDEDEMIRTTQKASRAISDNDEPLESDPVGDDGSGGAPEEEEERAEDGGPQIKIPLLIELTPDEHRQWGEIKKSLGCIRNVDAFKKIAGIV